MDFTQFLLGLLAVAFLAWAGVVYQGTRKATELLIAITSRIDSLDRELQEHKSLSMRRAHNE